MPDYVQLMIAAMLIVFVVGFDHTPLQRRLVARVQKRYRRRYRGRAYDPYDRKTWHAR